MVGYDAHHKDECHQGKFIQKVSWGISLHIRHRMSTSRLGLGNTLWEKVFGIIGTFGTIKKWMT